MSQLRRATQSPEETEQVASQLARELRPGDVVAVSGELGSGKTTFIRGACRALGVTQPVTSPTYTLGNRYDNVSHLDLYRLESVTEADWAGLEPYFEDAIVFVEWYEHGAGRLPPPRVRVRLAHAGEQARTIEVETEEPGLLPG